jgi:hypothetical protein
MNTPTLMSGKARGCSLVHCLFDIPCRFLPLFRLHVHSGLTRPAQCYQVLYLGSEHAPIVLNYELVLVS